MASFRDRQTPSRLESAQNSPPGKLPPINSNTANIKKTNDGSDRQSHSPFAMRKQAFISPLQHSLNLAQADRQKVDDDINVLMNRVQKLAIEHNHFQQALQQSNKRALEIYKTKKHVLQEKQENRLKMEQQHQDIAVPQQRQKQELKRIQEIQKQAVFRQIEEAKQVKHFRLNQLQKQREFDQMEKEEKRKRKQSIKEFEQNLRQKNFLLAQQRKLRVVQDSINNMEREKAITQTQLDQLQLWKFMEMELIEKLNKDQHEIEQTHQFLQDSKQMKLDQFQSIYGQENLEELIEPKKLKPKRLMINQSHNNSIMNFADVEDNSTHNVSLLQKRSKTIQEDD